MLSIDWKKKLINPIAIIKFTKITINLNKELKINNFVLINAY
jgi:hypothetical protein